MNFIYPAPLSRKNSTASLSYCVVPQVIIKAIRENCRHYSVAVNDLEVWPMCLSPPTSTNYHLGCSNFSVALKALLYVCPRTTCLVLEYCILYPYMHIPNAFIVDR